MGGVKASPFIFCPIVAETSTYTSALRPLAYDWVRVVFLRSGTAIVYSEFGEQPLRPGDALLLGANVLSGCHPEEPVTATTIFLDRDYLVDKVFWQHSAVLTHRLEASQLLDDPYVEPTQILHLSDQDFTEIIPWLDELTELSCDQENSGGFISTERLLLCILQVIVPHIEVSATRRSATQRHTTEPTPPRRRVPCPLRPEARRASQMMRSDLTHRWSLTELAETVHLSVPQFHRIFVDAYGKTPQTYLTMLRAQELARLLRETGLLNELVTVSVRPRGPGSGS